MGDRPEELLASADQALYARKRASRETPSSAELETKPAPLRVMVDLTCPHCQKMNSFAIIQNSGAGNTSRNEVQCAHCKEAWAPLMPGPIMAGPFPK